MNIIDDYSVSSSDSDSNSETDKNGKNEFTVPAINPNPEVALVIPKSEIENSLNKVNFSRRISIITLLRA